CCATRATRATRASSATATTAMTQHADPARVLAARRRFLRHGGALGAGGLMLSPLGRLLAQAGEPAAAPRLAGYGPLRPVRDDHTGLPLLWLPAGFSYRSFGWAGEPLADGTPMPAAHDGMGVVRSRGNVATVVRNHELVHS